MERLGKRYNSKPRAQMKHIKSFRITEENIKLLEMDSKERDRSQSWIVNQALRSYFQIKPKQEIKPTIL